MSGPRNGGPPNRIRTGLDTNTAFAMLDLSAALAAQHECPLDLTRTLPGKLVWYDRVCTRCRQHISAGWISFMSETGEFCEPCWESPFRGRAALDGVLDVDGALANGDAR